MSLSADQLRRLTEHQHLIGEVKRLTELEMAMRKEICAELLPNETSGTFRFELGATGAKLKIELKETVELDKTALDKLGQVYAMLTSVGNLAEHEASALIKSKTELSLVAKAYNKLTPELRKIMNPVIIIKNGAPTIEVELGEEE